MVDRLKIKLSEERNQLRKEIAALKAENERLAKERQDSAREWRIAFDNMHERAMAAERALAERAGGAKVKALEWAFGETKPSPDLSVWLAAAPGTNETYAVWHSTNPDAVAPYSAPKIHNGFYNSLDEAKAAAQADYERRILSALTTEPAAPAATETRRGKSREDLHKHEPDIEPDFLAGEQSGKTSPGAPEGRQEAGRIGDAVLDWMVKFDLLDAGNEYCVSDVLAVLNDLTPSTRHAEQAVTEALREAVGRLYSCRYSELPLARKLDAVLKEATGETYYERIKRQAMSALAQKEGGR